MRNVALGEIEYMPFMYVIKIENHWWLMAGDTKLQIKVNKC